MADSLNEIKDPTVQGTKGLKGVRILDEDKEWFESLDSKTKQSILTPKSPASLINRKNQQLLETPIHENIGVEGFGESKYDSGIVSRDELDDLNEERARLQPWWDQIGAGVLKGSVLAGTTFVDGVIGSIIGLANMAKTALDENSTLTEVGASFWNNPLSTYLQSVNEWSEEVLPNYYTKQEQEEPWYDNIFTSNFIGDKFIKNLGFAVGAAYSGKVNAQGMSKILGLNKARNAFAGSVVSSTGETIQDAKKAYQAYLSGDAIVDGVKLEAQLANAAQKLKFGNPLLQVTGATTGAFGEARIEAINTIKDWKALKVKQLEDSLPLIEEGIKDQMYQDNFKSPNSNYFKMNINPDGQGLSLGLTEEGQLEFDRRLKEKYELGMAKINQDALKVGNADFLMNLPLLAGSNWVQFGRMYAGGFNTSKNVANKINGSIEKGFETNLPNKLRRASKIASKGVTEGPIEEMGQAAISKAAGYKYASELNDFYGAKIDPDAEQETLGWVNAMAKGIADTYGDIDGWEEGFIGGLTGLLGIPGFRRVKSDGKIQSPLYLQGGIWEDIRDIKTENREVTEIVDQLNTRVKDPEFMNYYQGLIRNNKYQNDMEIASNNNDEFAFKNAEHSQMISDVVMFEKAGRIQELYDLVEGVGNIKEDQVEEIRQLTTDNTTGKSIYQDKTDEEVIEQIKKQASDYKDVIDRYRTISSNLKTKIGDVFEGEELDELTWMVTQIDNWENRFSDLHTKVRESVQPYLNNLLEQGSIQSTSDILTMSPMDLLSTITSEELSNKIQNSAQKALVNSLVNTLEVSQQETRLQEKEGNRGRHQMIKRLDRLKDALEKNQELITKYPELVSQVEDLSKIAKTRTDFIQKYQGYITNPQSLRNHFSKLDEKVENEVASKDINEIKKNASTTTTFNDFRKAIQSNSNIKLQREAVDELSKEGNEFAKAYKDIDNYSNEFYNTLNQTKLPDIQKEQIKKLFDNALSSSESLEDISNSSNPLFRDESALINEDGTLVDTEEFLETLAQLESIIKDVNNSKRFKDRLKTTISPNKGVSEKQPSKSLSNTSIGQISSQEMLEENSELNREVIKDENGNAKKYWKPAISEINLKELEKGNFIPLNQSNPNYNTIFKYLENSGAFQYVNDGNLKVGDSVGFMIDPILNEKEGFLSNTILIIKDNQVIGVLDETNASNFEGLQELRQRVLEAYKGTGVNAPIVNQSNNSIFDAIIPDNVEVLDFSKRTDKYMLPLDTDNPRIGYFELNGKVIKGVLGTLGTFNGIDMSYYVDASGDLIGVINNNGVTLGKIYDSSSSIEQLKNNLIKGLSQESVKEKLIEYSKKDGLGKFITTTSPQQTQGKYFHNELTHVNHVFPGRVPLGNTERSLSEIEGVENSLLGIMKSGQITIPNSSNLDIIQPLNRDNKEGRLYLMTKGADNKYYPTAVRVSRFNKESFNIEDESVKNTSRYKNIMSAIKKLAESKNNEDVFEAKQLLENELYLGDGIHLDYFSSEGNEGLRIRDSRLSNETPAKWIHFRTQEIAPSLGVLTDTGVDTSQISEGVPAQEKPIGEVINNILEQLYNLNLPIQINLNSLNSNNYNSILIKDNLLTSNIQKAKVVSSWFTMNPLDINGVETKAEIPSANNPEKGRKIETNVGGKESIIEGTRVNYNGVEYIVTPDGKILENNKIVDVPNKELIQLLSWIRRGEQGQFGSKEEFKEKYRLNNYYLLPNGKVLDINKLEFVDTDTSNRVKEELKLRLNSNSENIKLSKQVESNIVANQSLVMERPSDSNDNKYMIQENDGIYPYERVTNVIGSNWIGPTTGNRATNFGSLVDNITREFFQNNIPSRPEGITENAFNKLLTELEEIKTNLENKGERFLTNNIVLFGKFQVGNEIKRVAGEVDIISIDRNGNYKIYDLKTSKHSFTGQIFNEGTPNYIRSPKEQYTLQLSGYQNLFEFQYKMPIISLGILPFQLVYGKDSIGDLKREKGIPISYNSEVEKFIPKGDVVKESTEETKGKAALNRLNRFKGNNKTNSVRPLDNSNSLINFEKLSSEIKEALNKKGFTEESFNLLTEEEKKHEIECIK